MPRPAGHLNQEAVGNQLAAGGANSSRHSDLPAGSGCHADAAVTPDAADPADAAHAARRIDRTVGRRRSFRLSDQKKIIIIQIDSIPNPALYIQIYSLHGQKRRTIFKT